MVDDANKISCQHTGIDVLHTITPYKCSLQDLICHNAVTDCPVPKNPGWVQLHFAWIFENKISVSAPQYFQICTRPVGRLKSYPGNVIYLVGDYIQ